MDHIRTKFKGLNVFYHVVMRGARNMNIVEDDNDRWEFLRLIYFLNDVFQNQNWMRDLKSLGGDWFERPGHWPKQEPLIFISAFCLHDNHFHLLIKEIREGGLSDFMQRLPNSMTLRYNKRYGGQGTIFQSSYQYRRIDSDTDLMNVALYIMIKNVFEKYPEGLDQALNDFNTAYNWALGDSFSSFADYAANRNSPIISKDILGHFFSTPQEFKRQAGEYVKWRAEREEILNYLLVE